MSSPWSTFSQHLVYLISQETYFAREKGLSLIWEDELINANQAEKGTPSYHACTFEYITSFAFNMLYSTLSIQPLLRSGAWQHPSEESTDTGSERKHLLLSCTIPGLPILRKKTNFWVPSPLHPCRGDRKNIRQVIFVLGIPTAQVLMMALCWMLLDLSLSLGAFRLAFCGKGVGCVWKGRFRDIGQRLSLLTNIRVCALPSETRNHSLKLWPALPWWERPSIPI